MHFHFTFSVFSNAFHSTNVSPQIVNFKYYVSMKAEQVIIVFLKIFKLRLIIKDLQITATG